METIEATFRIVTPMFLGGADPKQASDGIRPPSVKGALRFWWRALNWGRFRGESGADDSSALCALHAEEGRLFGLAADPGGGGGQGCFLLRVKHQTLRTTAQGMVHTDFAAKDAARYLGYGLMVAFSSTDGTKRAGQLDRGCIDQGQEFTLTLVFRETVDESVKEALIAFGLVGGLGSRSRRGMGSISLITLQKDRLIIWTAPINTDDYRKKIQELTAKLTCAANEPPFSALWKNARIDRLLSSGDCFTALNEFGRAMLMYRSWGRSSRGGGSTVLRAPSEQRFKDDHDWYREAGWATRNANFHPERIAFGLPHNYHKDHHHVTAEAHERRSSPLLFHVHFLANNKFLGIAIYLPSLFLPAGEQIVANGVSVPNAVSWTVIKEFLDGTTGYPPSVTKRFPARQGLLP